MALRTTDSQMVEGEGDVEPGKSYTFAVPFELTPGIDGESYRG